MKLHVSSIDAIIGPDGFSDSVHFKFVDLLFVYRINVKNISHWPTEHSDNETIARRKNWNGNKKKRNETKRYTERKRKTKREPHKMNEQILFGMKKKGGKTICGNLKLYWFSMFHRLWWKTFTRYTATFDKLQFRRTNKRKSGKDIEEKTFRLECVWPTSKNSLQQKMISDFQYCLMSTSTYINSFYF